MKKSTFVILGLLLLVTGGGFAVFQKWAVAPREAAGGFRPKIPKSISCESFQRQTDKELMERLGAVETTEIGRSLDAFLVKPFFDDVNTRSLTIDGLEVTENQFPSLHALVMDCSRILHIIRTPRVFVSERPDLLIAVENLSEPVIVIHSSLLGRFRDEREQRFLIGREFGHIMAGHARWHSLLRSSQYHVNRIGIGAFPFKLAFLPLLEWAREAEMSADNAGLICAQDANIAERALIRLATGIDDFALHDINVNEYLKQADAQALSDFSDLALYWKEMNRPAPFAVNRIRQLRDYSESTRYQSLWK